MNYLEIKNIYKQWEHLTLDISFSTKKESFTCIVGPSGCGKSTLLKIIAGICPVSKNPEKKETSVILNGTDITNKECSKRNIGMVFQNSALFENMNVIDNIAYGLKCKGISKKERYARAREYLKRFNIEKIEKQSVLTLSGGESQRVALARTLIVNPELILFDEPLSALDAPLRKKLASDIVQLKNEFKFTAIMVTHDINEAKLLGDNIILMDNGKIKWQGKSEDFSESLM